MSKILVTGGAGYIGSILVPKLLEEGHEVTVIDNFMYDQNSSLRLCNHDNFNVTRGDVRDENLMRELIEGVDFIIPLAAVVGMPACKEDPSSAKEINLEAVKLILKLRNPDQKIVFPNTNSGYGIGEEGKYCDENSPLTPISLYGRTKVEAEEELLKSGNAISLRLATVFGSSPRMRFDLLVNDFVYRALVEKSIVLFEADFKRNYIHIRDVAQAFVHSINNFEDMKNKPYNVGLSSANLSKKELCEKIKGHIPHFVFLESEIGEDIDKRDYIVSNERIEKTGFKPEFSIDDGIKELLKTCQILRRNEYTNL